VLKSILLAVLGVGLGLPGGLVIGSRPRSAPVRCMPALQNLGAAIAQWQSEGASITNDAPVPANLKDISPEMTVEPRVVGTNTDQQYFLIEHKKGTEAGQARGLILILPGGAGTADFLPFCANVLTRYGIPADFVAAEMVAPQWSKDENRVVWPSRVFPDPLAKFTTEEFVAAVAKDVGRLRKIDERYVFTLGWSSSGHALYSISLSDPKVRGSIIAMSRFLPGRMGNLDQARGRKYFLYHSPQDLICPFREAQLAERTLAEHGANVKLVSYRGGHGWVPNTYYCDRIMEGILWLKGTNSEPAGGGQPIRPGTNRTPSAADSRR
jgi:predicted esterase